jgi:hypothetical protein
MLSEDYLCDKALRSAATRGGEAVQGHLIFATQVLAGSAYGRNAGASAQIIITPKTQHHRCRIIAAAVKSAISLQ